MAALSPTPTTTTVPILIYGPQLERYPVYSTGPYLSVLERVIFERAHYRYEMYSQVRASVYGQNYAQSLWTPQLAISTQCITGNHVGWQPWETAEILDVHLWHSQLIRDRINSLRQRHAHKADTGDELEANLHKCRGAYVPHADFEGLKREFGMPVVE